jgi:hypothetical protein
MAQTIPPKVNPGDLINSSYFNQFVDAIKGLDQRVALLEATGSVANRVAISGFSAVQPVHVGDQIEIDGWGFLVPAVLNQVSMGGSQVTDLSSSLNSATKLFFPVPPIVGANDSGIPVTVTITNSNGTVTSPFQILVRSASVAPKGRISVGYTVPPVMPATAPNITPPTVYNFTFGVTAVTDHDGTYAFTPSITGAGWSAAMIDTNPMPLAAGASASVRIAVTSAAGVGALSLSVIETTPGSAVTPGNASIPAITANLPPPTPENRARVTLSGAAPGASIVGTGVKFTRNTMGSVTFTIVFNDQGGGDYTVSAAMAASAGWTPGGIDIPTFHVNAPAAGGTATQKVNVLFTATAGPPAAANTDLIFTVTRMVASVVDFTVPYAMPVTVA